MWLRDFINHRREKQVRLLRERLEALERNRPREIYVTVETRIDEAELLAELSNLSRNKFLSLLLTQIREGYLSQVTDIKPGQVSTDLINQLFGRISVIGEIQNILAQKNAEYITSLREAKTDEKV
jgi:hypothetical protein